MWKKFVAFLRRLFNLAPMETPRAPETTRNDPQDLGSGFGPPPPVVTPALIIGRSGHAIPTPLDGESFVSYATRVADHLDVPNRAGTITILGTPYLFTNYGGFDAGNRSNWAAAVDKLYFPEAHRTPQEIATEAQATARDAAAANRVFTGPIDVKSLTMEDWFYLNKVNVPFDVLNGSAKEIHAGINQAGSSYASDMAQFQVENYNGPLRQYAPKKKKD